MRLKLRKLEFDVSTSIKFGGMEFAETLPPPCQLMRTPETKLFTVFD